MGRAVGVVPGVGVVLASVAVLAAAGGASPAFTHNGSVASAYPIGGVRIDGDLSDWPEGLPAQRVETYFGSLPGGPADLDADFTVAHDEDSGDLLVAVRVRDDAHVQPTRGGIELGDSCYVYLDRTHATTGLAPEWVGAALVVEPEPGSEMRPGTVREEASEPGSGARASVAVQRVGDVTSYEWRIELDPRHRVGEARIGTTLGLEVMVWDVDQPGGEARFAMWGPDGGVTERGGRLGDVALLDATAFPGTIAGKVAWDDRSIAARPRLVRVESLEEPTLWLHAGVDAGGSFRVDVPAGDYAIRAASGLTDPYDGNGESRRVDRSARVTVTCEPGETVSAEELVLPTIEAPGAPDLAEGLLYDFDGADPASTGAVDELVEAFREFYGIPGVSVAIVADGAVAYHRTYGLRDVARQDPVEDTTLFEAASITKPVFAVAVMRLVEQGVLELDRPLFEYAPFPNIAVDERSRLLTARLVLSHRTGLPNWAWGGPGGWRDGGELKLSFAPGEGYGYSGEGFNYLGRVVESVTGKGLEEVLQQEVVGPMGMVQTHFSSNERVDAAASRGHWDQYVSYGGPPGEVSPASSMHTEAADMARFMISLCEGRCLAPETWKQVLEPELTLPPEAQDPSSPWPMKIGLGFFLFDTPHGRLVGHGGNNGDFRCKFGVLPELRNGYAIFTNHNHGEKLVAAFERLLLGD